MEVFDALHPLSQEQFINVIQGLVTDASPRPLSNDSSATSLLSTLGGESKAETNLL